MFCSDYCRQADSHGTEKDYCQCEHEGCVAANGQLSSSHAVLPAAVELTAGRLTIEFNAFPDLLDTVNSLADFLAANREIVEMRINGVLPKHSVASEPERLFVRTAVAAGTA